MATRYPGYSKLIKVQVVPKRRRYLQLINAVANGGTMWNQNKNEYSINDRKNPSEFIKVRNTTESFL